jgi:hypothetical protein
MFDLRLVMMSVTRVMYVAAGVELGGCGGGMLTVFMQGNP